MLFAQFKNILKGKKNNMINLKNKTMSSMIALILMISMTTSIMFLPNTSAHTPAWTIPTYAYVTAVPNPIGVGQYTTIVMWVDQNPPAGSGTSGPRWEGYKLDITKPDGTKETIGPMLCTSSVGSQPYNYIPDQVGTYTIVFSWPGQTMTNKTGEGIRSSGLPYIGDFFAGSTSAPMKLVVQQDPIAEWQGPPLPTDYWTRPIHAANREWSSIASNWLKGSWLVNNYQRWGTAPDSPHIMWTQPIVNTLAGGINDAAWPSVPSNVNDYESPWTAPIIMNGKIYYNSPPVSDWATYGYYCRDLDTGELIWYKNGTDSGLPSSLVSTAGRYGFAQTYPGLTQGQLYHYNSVNGEGILAYLLLTSGSTWYFLDANGNFRIALKNVPSGSSVTDQDGSLLRYSYNAATGNLLCWNSSQSIPPLSPTGTNQQQWKARFGTTIDAVNDVTWTNAGPDGFNDAKDVAPRSGYTMNLTIQKGLPGDINVLQDENRVPKMVVGYWIDNSATSGLGAQYTGGATDAGTGDIFSVWAVSINENVNPYSPYPEKTATQNTNLGFGASLLWTKNITVPITGKNYTWEIGGFDYATQTFQIGNKQTMQRYGYSLATGERIWGPTAPEQVMNYYGMGYNVYDGKILGAGYGGTLYAYDAKTGDLLWTYNATSVGRESPYGENYPLSISAVCDGKVFVHSTEHSPTKPLWRGSYLRCINFTDGTEMWKILDFNTGLGISDGRIISNSQYDNQILCIGKGPSATTVVASPKVSVNGDTVLIEGTVTDQSPGAKDTPAIADADMQAWMEYMYMQQAMPTDAKGVEVTLDAIDPNGNFVNIGTTTSDASGMFKKAFIPEVPGEYTIIATFAGSKSYGYSYAETAIAVSDAPATPAPTAAPMQSTADLYFVPAIAGIIVAIIIVGAVLALLMLRKRP